MRLSTKGRYAVMAMTDLAARQDADGLRAVSLAEIAARLTGTSVLLIGESPGFAQRGGTINFVLRDNKVRFEINPAAAKASGLVISSKLLAIATVVGNPEKANSAHAPIH